MDVKDVYPQVVKIMANVLAVDEGDISLDKRLITDLGAESIDFLDLFFQLERQFSIKIPRGQIKKEILQFLAVEKYEENGFITPEGIQALKNKLPEVPEVYFKNNLKVADIPTLYTVETVCRLVLKAKLDKKNL